jgi:putative FmdB family regulatory protein
MPTYDYRCRKCGHQFEVFHGIKDEAPKRCPKCRGRAQRVPASGVGVLFKGSGFYVTDYRSKAYKEKARQEKSAGSGGATAGEASGGRSGGGGTTGGTGGGSSATGGAGGGSSATGGKKPSGD